MTSSSPLRLYVDTNIFLDHFLRRPGKSSALLTKIAKGQFIGITSHFTLSELTGVLKELRLPQQNIDAIINKVQSFPNLQVILYDQNMFLSMPQTMLDTCVQCRDALHFIIAKYLGADKIVTRDNGFKHAVNSVIECVTPEQLLP